MQKALAVETLSQLEKSFSPEFSRIYFGAETCERKTPSVADVKKAKAFCKKRGLSFSLLTPFCTGPGITKLQKIFPLLSDGDELVVNDWGVLHAAERCNAEKVAGRLLNKQFRDPRIASFSGRLPPEALGHLSLSHAAVPEFREILSCFKIKRVELDNLPQGIGTSVAGTGFSASLYFPFALVSATRLCLCANAGRISESGKVGIFPCGMECLQYKFTLRNSVMGTLFLFGNALFAKNPKMPPEEQLLRRGVDRAVFNDGMQLF